MIAYNNLYKKVISFENLILAWKKARKGKTKKSYVIEFENNIFYNLMALHYELKLYIMNLNIKPIIQNFLRILF